MKYFEYIFSFILTLSLSALVTSPKISNTTLLINRNQIDSFTDMNIDNSKDTFINLSTDEQLEVFKSNDKIIYLTENDIYLMSQIVYAESKGEPFEGKVAVASVILNRVLSPQFPSTVEGVVFQPYAFSCVIDGFINVEPTAECFDAVYEAIQGNDPTGEALFFYNPDIATCSWMQSVEKTNATSIGQHVFFTL